MRRKQQKPKEMMSAKVRYGKQFMCGVHAYMKESGAAIRVSCAADGRQKWVDDNSSGSVLAMFACKGGHFGG